MLIFCWFGTNLALSVATYWQRVDGEGPRETQKSSKPVYSKIWQNRLPYQFPKLNAWSSDGFVAQCKP
jgi:hypothetical protein